MKIELDSKKPDIFTEKWPGQYKLFSWMEYVTAIPQPISLITTLKENGQPNVCLHAWCTFTGEKDDFFCIISILKSQHTYQNILRSGKFCIGFPEKTLHEKCFATTRNNEQDEDEITKSGFTIESAKNISVPRIKECFLSLECSLEWEKPLFETSQWAIICGKVTHIAMEEERLKAGLDGRYGKNGYIFNIHAPKNPADGSEIEDKIGFIQVVEP